MRGNFECSHIAKGREIFRKWQRVLQNSTVKKRNYSLGRQNTKLLISLRRENDDLFAKGKVRKNVAWQKIAEKFNLTSSVKVMGEQCSNKWKKLEEKYKKVKEHNDKTGNDRKECDFQQELEEFFGTDPKIIPTATVSSLTAKPATGNTSTDDEEELPLASCREPPKKKRKRRSKSSATEMIEFLTEYKEEKRKEEEAKIVLAQKMHNEKWA